MTACEYCGKEHPSHEHVLAVARGDADVEPGTFRLDADLRAGAILGLALKNARALAEEAGDARLAAAFRGQELAVAQACERDRDWRQQPVDDGAGWRQRIELEGPPAATDAPPRLIVGTFSSDRLPMPDELAQAWAIMLAMHGRAEAMESEAVPVRRVVVEMEPV
jgi:hypothetical protein